MSASIVSALHVNLLVYAGLSLVQHGERLRWFSRPMIDEEKAAAHEVGSWTGPGAFEVSGQLMRELDRESVGAVLLAENARSVNHRYDADDWESVFEYTPMSGRVDPLHVLGALGYYEYQSCEHPDWDASEAQAFCTALRHLAIRKLPGYDWVVAESTEALGRVGVSIA
ncbi:hypothetical protein ACFV9C_43765 [Kribbella sp. NPDC059898]|uniref:hypothetical protein n=1 Tax=Kribbella sp. NPDC059898 TaxID=3346995 RepID=UPI00364D28AB